VQLPCCWPGGGGGDKLLSRLLNLALSVVIGALFKQLWKLTAGEEEAPQAGRSEAEWKQVLPAAALQGALFATVKAAVQRGATQGRRKLQGPGTRSSRTKTGRPPRNKRPTSAARTSPRTRR
jgi:hypothetical protein